MKVHHALTPRTDRAAAPLVVAVGFFDGFHLGHRAIVRQLLRLRAPGHRAAVLTFANHPSAFLRPGTEPTLLTTTEERVNLLAESGIDELYLLRFDASIASLAPRAFLEGVLAAALGARAVVVGENFRYGTRRAGDVELARRVLTEERGIVFRAVPNVVVDGERVSSTRIRGLLASGAVDEVDRLLGASYTVRGRVVLGEGRGHDLGFPTANLAVSPEKGLPCDGVYTMTARHDGSDHRGLVSIGDKPTFEGRRGREVEAWLLDFDRTIYGEELALRDLRFVREQRRFASVDELREQIGRDAAEVRFPSF